MARSALLLLLFPAVLTVAALLPRPTESPLDVDSGPAPVHPGEHGIGRRIPNIGFTDTAEREHSLASLCGTGALVIALVHRDCPTWPDTARRLPAVVDGYGSRGVTFLLVLGHPGPAPDGLSRAAKATGALAVVDADGTLLRALGARRSGEVFVLDAARTLQYRGAFARAPDPRTKTGGRAYVREALDAVLSRQPPTTPATDAPGVALSPETTQAVPVTYHNRISRIVQRNCEACHREGSSGPFSLETYGHMKSHASMTRWVVRRGLMPPWFASESGHALQNDARLAAAEKKDLLDWIDGGMPEGDPADAPIPRKYVSEWTIGTPDRIFQVPEPFPIPADGVVDYQYVEVPSGFTEDRWIRAWEVLPTSPGHLHHVLIFLRYPPGHPLHEKNPLDRRGLGGYFAGMVPGEGATTYPEGFAKRVPAGAIFLFQLHYTPTGTAAVDQTRLGLRFTTKPRHEVLTSAASNHRFRIPAGAPRHPVGGTWPVDRPIRLLALHPHMHVRGTAFRYDVRRPGHNWETILRVPRYDFNWQLVYELARPITLPAGSKLRAVGWFDNSADNPANPDPTTDVRFGQQTWEEMMIGHFVYHYVEPAEAEER